MTEDIHPFHKQLLRLLVEEGPLSLSEIVEKLEFRYCARCARRLLPILHLLERKGFIRVIKRRETMIENVYSIDEDRS